MRLGFSIRRRTASAAEVEAALARLEHEPGLYFGCDAGVAGLHPLGATLVVAPALALEVHEDGADVTALDGLGAALLRHSALADFVAAARRGEGGSAIAAARCFLAAFGTTDAALWVGALRFECHRLAAPSASLAWRPRPHGDEGRSEDGKLPQAPAGDALLPLPLAGEGRGEGALGAANVRATPSLGVLYFAPAFLRRDDRGDWQQVEIGFEDPELAACQAAVPVAASARGDAARTVEVRNDAGVRANLETPLEVAAPPEDDFAPGGYADVVARAVDRLAREPLVSLTLSQSFRRRVGTGSASAAFAALKRINPAPATFFVALPDGERLFGASPDLQLVVRGREVEALPVCGTVARGDGPVGEAASLRMLLNEEVDAASLAVCTDALRNDLAPLCEPGSLRLVDRRRPLALATVVHTVDRLRGRLRSDCDAWDAIVATAAPVMVTGTPRRRALAAIEALEASPRGWYGGLVVQVAADGEARVGTILRAAALRGDMAEVRTGGDLMADSDPAREEHESRIKAVSLWRALGMPVEAGLQAALAGGKPMSIVAHSRPGALPVAVRLQAGADPFAAALADALAGLGVILDDGAPLVVRAGGRLERTLQTGRKSAKRHGMASDVDDGNVGDREVDKPGVDDPDVADRDDDDRGVADGDNADRGVDDRDVDGRDGDGRDGTGIVAIGDAAARRLAQAGFAIVASAPAHGRLVRCTPRVGAALGLPREAFVAMRYATLELAAGAAAPLAGWAVWAADDTGRPMVLAHAALRTVCLLMRPESLLSDPAALEVLRAALVFAAAEA